MPAPNNPHDALFRAMVDDVGRAAVLIRDYLPAPIAALLADKPPKLEDGSFVDEELRNSQSDRLFSVATRSGRPAFLYALLEHKSTPDPQTPLQLLGYMVRIWRRYGGTDASRLRNLPPIIPLVFYHGKQAWEVPTSIFECLDIDDPLWNPFRDLRYVLCNVGTLPDAALASDSEVNSGFLALKYVDRDTDLEILLETVVRGLRDGTLFELQVIHYIFWMYPAITSTLWKTVVHRVKPHREDEMVSLAAQEWMRQGKAEGWMEGLAEGQARSILAALETRFGPVSPEVEARVLRAAPPHQLDALLRRALTATSLDAVFAEDRQH
jgi:predicted transposase YdaD